MKNLIKISTSAMITFLMCIFTMQTFSQESIWSTEGNELDSTSVLGSTNTEDLRLITNDTVRIVIDSVGDVSFKHNVAIDNGYLRADSIHARVIHAGDSSIFIGNAQVPGSNNGNVIRTTPFGFFGSTLFIMPGNGFTSFLNWGSGNLLDSRVSIGHLAPNNKLQLHDLANTPVYTQFTNATIGADATDGLLIGIADDGTADIHQQENLDMRFWTNDQERMRILAGGNSAITGDKQSPRHCRLQQAGDTHRFHFSV